MADPRSRLGRFGSAMLPTSGRTASVVATLMWLLGLMTILSALLPADRSRLRVLAPLVPTQASDAATGVAAALGILLLYLAGGLRRRKRRAWEIAVGATVAVAAAHLVKGLDVEEATASLGILALLLWTRREFFAAGDPASRGLALRRVGELLFLDVSLGLVLLQIYDDRLVGHPSFVERLRHVVLGLVGVTGPVQVRGDRAADVIGATLLSFGLLTAFVAAYFTLRSAKPHARQDRADERRLRELLAEHGARDSLGYFALRRDKSVVWSPSGKAAVTYRVVQGVLLASGDPIGDPEAWPGAIAAALDLAGRHAWVPAVMGCGELGATAWARHGLDAYELGDEAILDVPSFTLDGRPMRGVRQAVGRVARAGYEARIRRVADLSPAELASMVAVADAWRGAEVERGFSMALSRLGDPADGDCVMVCAYQDDVLRGLLHFVPWGADGLSLDVMRRDRTADNGLNEFLIAELLATCPSLRVRRLSLNFAVFRSALERGARIGAGPVSRLWRSVLVLASRWFQIESLYRFNAKFQPSWEPRFLSFPSARDLPRIAVAALEAEAFLVRPRLLDWLLRGA